MCRPGNAEIDVYILISTDVHPYLQHVDTTRKDGDRCAIISLATGERAQALGYAVENPTGFGRRVPGVVSRVRFGCFGFVVPLVAAFDRHFAFDWMFRCDAVGDQLL